MTSSEVRIAHTSDVHLGARPYGSYRKEVDIYEAFGELIDKVIEERADYLLISGDIFDESVPRNAARRHFRKALRRLNERGIRVIGILGDHDRPKRLDLPPTADILSDEMVLLDYSPQEGSSVERLSQRSFLDRDRDLFVVGYCNRRSELRKKKDIQGTIPRAEAEARRHRFRILMMHQALRELYPFDYTGIPIGWIPRTFQYVAMGHIHNRRERRLDGSLLVYPGAIEIHRRDEIGEKGFYLVDLGSEGPEAQFVKLESVRPQYVLTVDENNLLSEVLSRIGNGKPPIFHLDVSPEADKARVDDLVNRLRRDYEDKILLIRVKYLEKGEEGGMGAPVRGVSLEEIIEEFGEEYKDLIISILRLVREVEAEKLEDEIEDLLLREVAK